MRTFMLYSPLSSSSPSALISNPLLSLQSHHIIFNVVSKLSEQGPATSSLEAQISLFHFTRAFLSCVHASCFSIARTFPASVNLDNLTDD